MLYCSCSIFAQTRLNRISRTARSGVPDFDFYLAFSIFRLASIGQGVFKRNLDGIGNADTPPDNAGTRELARTARAILER